jgi:hypothetical protein
VSEETTMLSTVSFTAESVLSISKPSRTFSKSEESLGRNMKEVACKEFKQQSTNQPILLAGVDSPLTLLQCGFHHLSPLQEFPEQCCS